ncbi:MAG TPA: TIGR03435 family protein [Vicinamibacterales bacterium]|jgi:uncharacterized protein (TIGR03435 family)|nr:TIGR03435 family protein [Vicinamibacterales bacterium]
MTRTLVVVAATVMTSVALPRAQSARGFDVASVKRIQAAPGMPPLVVVQAGRLRAPFSTVRDLMQAAYGVEPSQIVSGPGWVDSDRFEIAATLPAGTAMADAPAMLQKLLADRFGLVVHREKRNLPVLILERAGKLGSDLSLAGSGCKEPKPPAGLPVPPPPPPPPTNAGPVTVLNTPPGSRCASIVFNGFFSMRSVPFGSFVTDLSRQSRRIIIDRTNLTGFYDVDLYFVPDAGPLMVNGNAINADAPSLQAAVREQLGLRIDSARAPVDVVVIDRVSTPTEN